MGVYVILLRGINVGGKKIVKMDELKKLLEERGYPGARTYIQSGNIVLSSDSRDAATIREGVSASILERFGFPVETIVRSAEAFRAAVRANPFRTEAATEEGRERLYATLLDAAPDAESKLKLGRFDNGADRFKILGDTVYTLYADRYGASSFSNSFIEKALGRKATTRNWTTMEKLAKMCDDGGQSPA